jgi:hypothetical protein
MARTVRTRVDILKLCLPMGTLAANGRNEDSVRRPFLGSSSGKSVFARVS